MTDLMLKQRPRKATQGAIINPWSVDVRVTNDLYIVSHCFANMSVGYLMHRQKVPGNNFSACTLKTAGEHNYLGLSSP